jgi:hypothetical protein
MEITHGVPHHLSPVKQIPPLCTPTPHTERPEKPPLVPTCETYSTGGSTMNSVVKTATFALPAEAEVLVRKLSQLYPRSAKLSGLTPGISSCPVESAVI